MVTSRGGCEDDNEVEGFVIGRSGVIEWRAFRVRSFNSVGIAGIAPRVMEIQAKFSDWLVINSSCSAAPCRAARCPRG
jgi:hypothetical protein